MTVMLEAAVAGDKQAAEDLLPVVYDELRALARRRMVQLKPGQTLQPTALVHDVYLRLIGDEDPGWAGRNHFFGAAARAMRNIIVEQYRRKRAVKHGGDRERVPVEQVELPIDTPNYDVLDLNEALEELEADDPRKGEIVNMRCFAGLTAQETADAIGVSLGTIEREWRYIKVWLHDRLSAPESEADEHD